MLLNPTTAMWGIYYFYDMKQLLTLLLILGTHQVMGQTECEKRLSLQEIEIQKMYDSIKINEYKLNLLQKENEALRDIMKGYVIQIDSLNTELIQLKYEHEKE